MIDDYLLFFGMACAEWLKLGKESSILTTTDEGTKTLILISRDPTMHNILHAIHHVMDTYDDPTTDDIIRAIQAAQEVKT